MFCGKVSAGLTKLSRNEAQRLPRNCPAQNPASQEIGLVHDEIGFNEADHGKHGRKKEINHALLREQVAECRKIIFHMCRKLIPLLLASRKLSSLCFHRGLRKHVLRRFLR